MNSKVLWNDQIPERDGVRSPINDIAISPDGSRLIVATGNRVLLYKTENGDLIESLRGHKDTVYTVSFSSDGTRFSSGGADNIVVIWKISGQGLLKYNHSAPVQRVKYNPTKLLLASCSEVDFGLWTPEQKQVTKEKTASRILTAAWSSDGNMLALGMLNGVISIRNLLAQEIMTIERKAPIWCLTFIPETAPVKTGHSMVGGPAGGAGSNEVHDSLAVGCWDKTYSLYRITNNSSKVQHEKKLHYYPTSISYTFNQALKSSYLIVTGSNKKALVYSREGAKLMDVCEKDTWVWCADGNGELDTVAIGDQHGSIDYVKVNFDKVHSLYKDRYTYRENLTEVMVQHLVTDKKVRIKCKDLIQNLSLYRNNIAVQLSDRVCIYESSPDNFEDMHFRLRKEKIHVKDSSSDKVRTHLGITTMHLLFGVGKVLELYTFGGIRQRTWTFDAVITFLRVEGGPEGREAILVGLKNGAILKVFVTNPFPIEVTKLGAAVAQVDTNLYRSTIASVDVNNVLTVMDVKTQTVLHTSNDVLLACFNTEVEHLLCITSVEHSISVLTLSNEMRNAEVDETAVKGAGELQEQHINGVCLGFRGQRIYAVNRGVVQGIDVPQGYNIQKALENNDIFTAYKIACLGATEVEWKLVAMRALRSNNLTIAKSAFARLKDTKFLSLLDRIERHNERTGTANAVAAAAAAASAAEQGARGGRGRHAKASDGLAEDASGGRGALSALPLDPMWVAEIMAYEGHHTDAAKIYARNNKVQEAIRLFTDLKQWENAKLFARNAGQVDTSALSKMQAQWLQDVRDWKGSADLFCNTGQYLDAARSIADHIGVEGDYLPAWQESLLSIVHQCPGDNTEALVYCGEAFASHKEIALAKEAFEKAKDVTKLINMYAKEQMWKEAGALADEHEGSFDVSIFLSYAEWLVTNDQYEDAMVAFKKGKRVDLSRKVLEELTHNAVVECRFKDAAYFYWMLAKETELEMNQAHEEAKTKTGSATTASEEKERDRDRDRDRDAKDNSPNPTPTSKTHSILAARAQHEYEHKADLYFAYANVHAYMTDPFTSLQPEMIFQVSRFIINSLGSSETMPEGISKASTVYTLARQAMALGAYKLARDAYERLSKLQLPSKRMDEVEIDMLLVQAKPLRDNPDHLPVCYRCSMPNPLLNPFTNKFAKGDVCTNCGHPFVRSFINFDILPLVEFVPDPSISDEEAIDMIRQAPPALGAGARDASFYNANSKRAGESKTGGDKKAGGWRESKDGEADMLQLDAGDDDEVAEDVMNEAMGLNSDEQDPFTRCLNLTLQRQEKNGTYTPVKVDAYTLSVMRRSEVFVCRPSSQSKRATFYRSMLPDLPIAISQPCHRFFHLEDFEFAYLSEQKCPYSRLKNVGEYGSL